MNRRIALAAITVFTLASIGIYFVLSNTVPEETLTPIPEKEIHVYFGNGVLDPDMTCVATFPVVRRVSASPTIGRAALEELLRGPREEEADAGYFTSINSGVRLRSLSIRDGVAYADFDAEIERGIGGSCRVGAIRSEITNTLRQFPSVREVVVSVEGRVDDVLQP